MLSVKGRSVSSCRNTRYAEGASSFFHSSSVFVTFTTGPISIFGCIVLFLSCVAVSELTRGTECFLTHRLAGEQGSKKRIGRLAAYSKSELVRDTCRVFL